MAKTRSPKATGVAKPTAPSAIVVAYDLFTLPTAFHKAGLAGLVLLIKSLTARQILAADVAICEVTRTGARVTFTESLVRTLMDDVYDAEHKEVAVKSKWQGVEVARPPTASEREAGTPHIYRIVQPKGAFFDNVFDGEKEIWRKLWRDMLWNIPRSRPTSREPYNQRADGQSCKEGPNAWAELARFWKAREKNTFFTAGLSSALIPGAQAVNAEGVAFEGRAEQNILLHFWPLTVLVFVPQQVNRDGTTSLPPSSYSLAIPDVSNLTEFVRDYPNLLACLSGNARGYRPAQSVIDLPAEGALAFLEDLAELTGLLVETGELRFSTAAIEYLHLVKEGNNVKTMAAGRVSPSQRLLTGYRAIASPPDETTRYRNPLFRRGLLEALFDDVPWFQPFGRTFSLFDAEVFIRQPRQADGESGPPQFAFDVAKKLRHETNLFTQTLQRHTDMPDIPRPTAPPAVIVNRVVRGYLLARTQEKTGIDPEKYKSPEGGTDYKAMPPEFNEAKQKLALSLILEFRSRRDQALVDHFAATFFSVTQRLSEPDRLELANLLTVADRRDDLKTLVLLSLSANS
jgi:CRISPR-associated protein Cmx8